MKPYQNKSGKGGIAAYENGDDSIIIKFKGDRIYLYNTDAPGKKHVNKMKMLAEAGQGLATYINKYVRENYAEKLG
ncbi:MAG: hypothetical protein EOP51_12315 [Sphingobacteriales bacterium]|nr:MAG: hypothetical protein EOP51_12315 [Sphingobacteriales bacterium]